ncbi:MAG: hypothetical protein MSG64_04845 [Pyrinomonadaceae bacterium MAG19_C2-C3]|nr:hypothetical protein [Pyrinomonadaceae bacterium MAG19_C2-C3]
MLFTFYLLLSTFYFAFAQTVTDKMVATVNDDLVTYSDLIWQLALQPDTPLVNPRSEDLQRALQTVIDQRLVAQEAAKLPTIMPTDAEVDRALGEFINRFRSASDFYTRAQSVGLSAEQVREIVRTRVAIEKYLDFRFRTFTIVTQAEIADYYNGAYTSRFRAAFPGRIVPTFEQARKDIEEELINGKIAVDIDNFLDDARARADIVILNAV